jgi:hypothetical protein
MQAQNGRLTPLPRQAKISDMPSRREFLKTLAAIPLVGPLLAGAFWPDDFAGGDTFTMQGTRVDFDLLRSQLRINSHRWRGHSAGSVQLCGIRGDRNESGTWDVQYTFQRVPKPFLCYNSRGEVIKEFPASETYGTADFNEFDFGEVLRG